MVNAAIDDNFKPTLIGVSSDDGITPTRVEINPATGRTLVDATGGMTAGVDFDYLDVQQTDSDTETYIFKTGGSGGTTRKTIVVNYTDSTKENIDNVSWS